MPDRTLLWQSVAAWVSEDGVFGPRAGAPQLRPSTRFAFTNSESERRPRSRQAMNCVNCAKKAAAAAPGCVRRGRVAAKDAGSRVRLLQGSLRPGQRAGRRRGPEACGEELCRERIVRSAALALPLELARQDPLAPTGGAGAPTVALNAPGAGYGCANVCSPRRRRRTGPGGGAAMGCWILRSEPNALAGVRVLVPQKRATLCFLPRAPRNRVGTVGTVLETALETVVIYVETVESLLEGVSLNISKTSSRFLHVVQRFLKRFLDGV